MSKLTKKQTEAIAYALRNAERAYNFIHQETTVICRSNSMATTTLHFTRNQPPAACTDGISATAIAPIAKDIGSDLVGLGNAIVELRRLLAA